MARRLAVPRSTVFRLLMTLEALGFITPVRTATNIAWRGRYCGWGSSIWRRWNWSTCASRYWRS
ncbi:MAG: helix-turn-helix domain-containing protein [Sodalis sp. (in: enterobacteria)]|uniref:helix-turn-helix domain-containing protein n=1 Tax=Sodalis sp. (in: enterobacteria) TaxID=1898979 RepID=UPI0039E33709